MTDSIIDQAVRVLMRTPSLSSTWMEPIYESEAREFAHALNTAGLLRADPAHPADTVHPADVPQPGDRVRVTWLRTGNTYTSTVDSSGIYEGRSHAIIWPDEVAIEVIDQ